MKKLFFTTVLTIVAFTSIAKEPNFTDINILTKPVFDIETAFNTSQKSPLKCYNYCRIVVGLPSCAPLFTNECVAEMAECVAKCRAN